MTVHPFVPLASTPRPARCDLCPARDGGLCGCLDGPALAALSRHARWVCFDPDQEILPQDAASSRIGLILEGQVKMVRRSEDGAEQVLGVLGPGDLVGRPFEAVLPQAYEAATPVRLCLFQRASFETALERNPALQKDYLLSVLDALDRERLWAASLRGRSATERLAAWIAGMAERTPRRPPGRAVVEIALRRRDVAALLDMTPETFSRALHQIADRRAVRLLSPNRIEVVSEEGLAALASPGVREPA